MKILISTMMLMLASNYANSCDICGGIGSNVSAGMLLNERFHLIGIRSSNRMSTSYFEGIRHSREYVLSQEIYGRFQLTKRIQFIGAIPFQTAFQQRDLGRDVFSGIGDPYAFLNAILLEKKDSSGSTRSFLSLGSGVKFPLGKYESTSNGFQNLYPGTGSWDGLFTFNFVQRLKGRFTIQSDASYTVKTSNPVGFRYGNAFSTSAQLTHYSNVKGNRLLYALGGYIDHFEKSTSTQTVLGNNNNSGYTAGIRINANYLSRRCLVTTQINLPVFQSLNSGNVRSNGAIQLGIHYLIKTNEK
jgi:hypothetical protein